MLGFYNISLAGRSHVSAGIACQDASAISRLSNGWVIAVIADGLGSAKCSDIGSVNAVNSVIEYFENYTFRDWNVEELYTVLRESYVSAKKMIEEISEVHDIPVYEYDTTLTAAIYNGTQIVFAHVGDGGIILLSENGKYEQLTSVQKGDEFNCVEPLRNEKAWKFGASDHNVCAFAMFTDGIYDVVCPWLLSFQQEKIYINYVKLYMDMNIIKAKTEDDFVVLKENAEAFLLSEYNSNITDDKTVAVVVNTDVIPDLQPDEYYTEPDWEALKTEHNKKLYDMESVME